ncbi:FGGY family carbohydrate kinase [Salinibacterium sp. SYSU T00001]|uniref:xylulokinase n=1 Tax=Homoserinimonas sedimenticola TaxID=2986805 RepID=UPI002236B0CF|nr:FGGY family carbohydrate kinase [Salinibacterium sedimenticola]MCW4385204.1 FGGY family carbohydrate kinase [Salinibacterium sedimenticola]
MPLVAGIDSSTQSCKVVIRDAATGALKRYGRAPHPDGTEVDPEAWWLALRQAITAAGGLEDVAAVSIGGQQHGLVALDEGGRVIRPALLWNDTRSADAALALRAELGDAEIAARTGSVPVASFTSTKLRWLRDAEPENAARVAAVALPHDWLTWRLRGFGPDNPRLDELVTDRSDASGTGYYDPARGEYDRELLTLASGNSGIAVPTVLAPHDSRPVSGPVPEFPAVPGALIVGAGAGDNAAAALGLDARAGDVIVSIGTSGTVFAVTDTAVTDESGTVAGFADATGRFLPLVATLNAARVLDATAALLGVDHAELGRFAVKADAASGPVLVPWFEGERTPNLPNATATLSGLTLATTTRAGVARAAIEGMLCGLADGLDAVLAQGVTAERILLIGGAAGNPAVQAIAAQVFGVPVSVPTAGEYVADGMTRQAAWALTGERPTWPVQIAAKLPVDHRPEIRERYARARDAASGTG